MNGTEYETETEVTQSMLSDDNLSNVKVDGESIGKKVLLHLYMVDGVYHFALRDQTEMEMLMTQLNETQLALCDVYEMLV